MEKENRETRDRCEQTKAALKEQAALSSVEMKREKNNTC